MKTFLLFFATIFFALNSCTPAENSKIKSADQNQPVETEKNVDDYYEEEEPLPNRRFGKSEIINSKFDPKRIFGVWTTSNENPACDFEINEKRLLLCDYDGDGERLYRIVGDSIFLDNPTLIFKGKILKSTNDTLKIHWQQNQSPETLLRWKN